MGNSICKLQHYTDVYMDIDNTIREYHSNVVSTSLIKQLMLINTNAKLHFITDNHNNASDIEAFLRNNNINYFELVTPLKRFNIIFSEKNKHDGYKIDGGYVYITKFHITDINLLEAINRLKRIRVVDVNSIESIPNTIIECIGKTSLTIPYDNKRRGIMIGDSPADCIFARNNGLDFEHVCCPNGTQAFLQSFIE